ncbi:MAG TPA: hypothetical protein DET40_19935 [Lentisphaeria bacterium]|nr:MAG: hypothetical protein A2X45_00925 [Lentisphaerae bacterium GWF2_50_93]HCE45821.1 hypothetical protein [Lentisphaeria bacterium]
MKRIVIFVLSILSIMSIPSTALKAQDANPNATLEDFESVSGWEKQNGAQVEAADSASAGKGAVKFSGPGLAFKKVKGVKTLKPDSLNDGYEGISFWVKGDGSDTYGTIVLCGQHPLWFPFKYAYSFPLKDTEWKKIVVPWDKFVPEDPVYPIGTTGGMPPSGIQNLKIGNKWNIYFNNKPMPKFSFCIDQIQFEEKVPSDKNTPKLKSFEDVQKLLKDKKPVNILCLGDSITAGTSLKSPDTERYAQVLEKLLRKQYGYDQITVVSKAVGGAQGNDLRLWLDRDFAGNPPDLVTLMYGYNDKTWGYSKEYFTYSMNDYIERIARKTNGATSILLISTIPGKNERFFMMDDYAECVRAIAKERGLPLCDVSKDFKAFGREGIEAYMADQAHPNAKGHEVMANAIAGALGK